ncbi:MAG: ribonuclease III [Deltaproteobacteria bacterium]|nr:ribonuclease III [Deltaproteobacteria bacterium]
MDITREEKQELKRLEKALGYTFRRRVHLKRALTHRSYANEMRLKPTEHNERYEYLGDAVLELAVSHLLMDQYPDHPEGELSKLRAALVNEAQLADLAREVQLGIYLYLGKGEEQTGGREKPSLLADAFEAVLGAIYIDRGFKKCFDVVKHKFHNIFQNVRRGEFIQDFKTKLQEESQQRFRTVPRYRLVKESGPDHSKTFEVNLYIEERLLGAGRGPSKKAAEQDAARQALEKIAGSPAAERQYNL